jgi:hypothetical protein
MNSTCQSYNDDAASLLCHNVVHHVSQATGGLPFTGLDLLVLALVAGIMIAIGLFLRFNVRS